MIRFARNLLVVLFAAVGVFGVAAPAGAAVTPHSHAPVTHFVRVWQPSYHGRAVMFPHASGWNGPTSCFTGWSTHPFGPC